MQDPTNNDATCMEPQQAENILFKAHPFLPDPVSNRNLEIIKENLSRLSGTERK